MERCRGPNGQQPWSRPQGQILILSNSLKTIQEDWKNTIIKTSKGVEEDGLLKFPVSTCIPHSSLQITI